MKNIIFLSSTVFLLSACSKSDNETTLCSEDLSCIDEHFLFTVNNYEGVKTYFFVMILQ